MARIVIYSMCYRGDVFPHAPVAAELARRGHHGTFVAPSELFPIIAADGMTLADADVGEMCPSGIDHYGDYCARFGLGPVSRVTGGDALAVTIQLIRSKP